MYADGFGFDYKIAAGLHQDRLDEAESNRRAKAALMAKAALRPANPDTAGLRIEKHPARDAGAALRRKIGRQLIALGERMTA